MSQLDFASSKETKAVLRLRFLAERKRLAIDEVARWSQRIAEHFFAYLSKEQLTDGPTSIHTFLPIQQQNEVNTWLIIDSIWHNYPQLSVVVPVTDIKTGLMHHYALLPDTPLSENALGIPEPLPNERREADLAHVKLVIVPLLAFDQQGNRVGYGKGFYDRFLAERPASCQKIGVSLFDPVTLISDVEPTDIRLDACVTPGGIWHFRK